MSLVAVLPQKRMMGEMVRPQDESPHELRELTVHDLRHVKIEAQRIEALALIGRVTTASKPNSEEECANQLPHQAPSLG